MGTDIEKIISGYLRSELSDLEKAKLQKWINESPSHEVELKALEEIWKTPIGYPGIINKEDEQKKIWDKLQNENGQSVDHRTNPVSISRTFLKYAAAIILFVGLGYLFRENFQPEVEIPIVLETIERINPLGQKSRIQLPDGSNVWLNAGSKLSYSSEFNQDARKLYLEGEAYFEVAKNPNKPFEVFTADLVITALGTSFNVCAFEEGQLEKIALNTGEVKIECLSKLGKSSIPSYLKPGDLAIFEQHSMKISISEYDGLDPFGWKDGRIVFRNATFQEVVNVLSRWYNVKFEISGSLQQDWNYGSTFENEILVNVLESLKFSEKIDYELNGSIVKIQL